LLRASKDLVEGCHRFVGLCIGKYILHHQREFGVFSRPAVLFISASTRLHSVAASKELELLK
jgi:hypothetical protein